MPPTPDTLTITRPDDWHLHLRQGALLATALPHTAARFARAMIMPNLAEPVTTVARAHAYRAEILAALPASAPDFTPLMSLYLTDNTDPREVKTAAQDPHIVGYKLYPAGATTNSDNGVTRISKIMPVLEAMAEHQIILQVHGEVTDPQIDIFDREAVFIEQILAPLHRELPDLKIILEHITTEQGIQFVADTPAQIAGTLTVHHLLLNRNEMFRGGLRPHAYCLPVLKREKHRQALRNAAVSNPAFFAGTDSAPHTRTDKESACGCAGIYTAHAALELYAEIFDEMGALPELENFLSKRGADFYQRPHNPDTITLRRTAWRAPEFYSVQPETTNTDTNTAEIVPLRAGEEIAWQLA